MCTMQNPNEKTKTNQPHAYFDLRAMSSDNPFAGKALTAAETDKLLRLVKWSNRRAKALKILRVALIFALGIALGYAL